MQHEVCLTFYIDKRVHAREQTSGICQLKCTDNARTPTFTDIHMQYVQCLHRMYIVCARSVCTTAQQFSVTCRNGPDSMRARAHFQSEMQRHFSMNASCALSAWYVHSHSTLDKCLTHQHKPQPNALSTCLNGTTHYDALTYTHNDNHGKRVCNEMCTVRARARDYMHNCAIYSYLALYWQPQHEPEPNALSTCLKCTTHNDALTYTLNDNHGTLVCSEVCTVRYLARDYMHKCAIYYYLALYSQPQH